MSSPVALAACLAVSAGCTQSPPLPPTNAGPGWEPGVVYRTPADLGERGLLDRRGLLHAHSIYSHDACDGEPHDGDFNYDMVCFDDFRRGVCQTRHDFVFLTDHRDSFNDNEFPDVLLYDEVRGDSLVERDGAPVANWAACEDGGRPALIMAGNEGAMMPVGLERHVAPRDERSAIYGDWNDENVQLLREAGAVVIMQHTEQYAVQDLIDRDIDGFEMFNLHANFFRGMGMALDFILRMQDENAYLPHPDLAFLPILSEDPAYVDTWGTVAASGVKRVTTMGTDTHRNSLPALMEDGERIDSYRRMMLWFSNHLLIKPEADGSWDDRHLKEALRAGRLYGAFELMGYPVGFEYVATAGDKTWEMGDDVPFAERPVLTVKRPSVQNLDWRVEPPQIIVRILRAKEGGWDEVASSDSGDVVYTPDQAGAYRAEVRMMPFHLRDFLGDDEFTVLRDNDHVWIYSNPVYVR
jgi:hypothetical protein